MPVREQRLWVCKMWSHFRGKGRTLASNVLGHCPPAGDRKRGPLLVFHSVHEQPGAPREVCERARRVEAVTGRQDCADLEQDFWSYNWPDLHKSGCSQNLA